MHHFPLRFRLGALVLAVGLVAAVARAGAQPRTASTQEIVALLHRDIDLSEVPTMLKLRDVLGLTSQYLTKKNHGKEVRVLLDVNAFKRENEEVTSEQLLGEEVEITVFPRKMTVAGFLRNALDKLPSRNATYLVRRGVIEVTTRNQASLAGLLKRKVAADFTGLPLKDAFRELSDLTGASIITDPRVADKLKQPVTATFQHDTSLGAALRMLADMAGLKLAVLQNGLYVTTARGARALEQEDRRLHPAPQSPLAYLLDPADRPVTDSFDGRPLGEALEDLAQQTGASIVLDGRVGDRAKAPVTATFRKETPVRAAVRVLADMAGLRAVVTGGVIYVTTPARAARLERGAETLSPRTRRTGDW